MPNPQSHILWLDMVNSVLLSKQYRLDNYLELISSYYSIVTAIVDRYQGQILSSLGDGLTVYHTDNTGERLINIFFDVKKQVEDKLHVTITGGMNYGPYRLV